MESNIPAQNGEKYVYALVYKEHFLDCIGKYLSYGITCSCDGNIVLEIADISVDNPFVNNMVNLLNINCVALKHFMDVVVDNLP